MSRATPEGLSSEHAERWTRLSGNVSVLVDAARAGDSDALALAASSFPDTDPEFTKALLEDATFIPDDAGDYTEGLSNILRRIPPGWGRWISCGAGWYPLLVQLDADISAIAPDYEVHQVKEKFGGLRFYFGLQHRYPACCIRVFEEFPVPPREDADREEWSSANRAQWDALIAHVASGEHDSEEQERLQSELSEIEEVVDAIVRAAEDRSIRTCEECGGHGEQRNVRGWISTLCDACLDADQSSSGID